MADKRYSRKDKTGTSGDKLNARQDSPSSNQNGKKASKMDSSWSSSSSTSSQRPKPAPTSPPRKSAERRSRPSSPHHRSKMPTVEEKNEQQVAPETDPDPESLPPLRASSSHAGVEHGSSSSRASSSRTSRIPTLTTSRDSVHELKPRDGSKTNVAIPNAATPVTPKSARRKSTTSEPSASLSVDLSSTKGLTSYKSKELTSKKSLVPYKSREKTKTPEISKSVRSRPTTPDTSRSSLRTSHSRCTEGYSSSTLQRTPGRRDSASSEKESPSPTRKGSLPTSPTNRKANKVAKTPVLSGIKQSLSDKSKEKEKTPLKPVRGEKSVTNKSSSRTTSDKKKESSAVLLETKPKASEKTKSHGSQSPKKFNTLPTTNVGTVVWLEVDNGPMPETTSVNVGTEDDKCEDKMCSTTSSLRDGAPHIRVSDKQSLPSTSLMAKEALPILQNVSLSHSFLEMRRAADDAFYDDGKKPPTLVSGGYKKTIVETEKYPQRPKSQPDILEPLNLPEGIKSMPPSSSRPAYSPLRTEKSPISPPSNTKKDKQQPTVIMREVGTGRKKITSPFKPIAIPITSSEKLTSDITDAPECVQPPIKKTSEASKIKDKSPDRWAAQDLSSRRSPAEKATYHELPVQENIPHVKSPVEEYTPRAKSPVQMKTPRTKSPTHERALRDVSSPNEKHKQMPPLSETISERSPYEKAPHQRSPQRKLSVERYHAEPTTLEETFTPEISSLPTSSGEKFNTQFPTEIIPREVRHESPDHVLECRSPKRKGDKLPATAQIPSDFQETHARIVRVRDSGTQTRELKWAVSENTLLGAPSSIKSEELPTSIVDMPPNSIVDVPPKSVINDTVDEKNLQPDSKLSAVGFEKVDVALALERGLLHLLTRVHDLVEGYIQEQLTAATASNSSLNTLKQPTTPPIPIINTVSAATQATSALPSGSSAPSSFQMVTSLPPPTSTLADIAKAANDAATKLANLMLAAAGLGPDVDRPKSPKTCSLPCAPSVHGDSQKTKKKEGKEGGDPTSTPWEDATRTSRIHDQYVVRSPPSSPKNDDAKKNDNGIQKKPVASNRFKAGLNSNYSHYTPSHCHCCYAVNPENNPCIEKNNRNQPAAIDEAIQADDVLVQPAISAVASMNSYDNEIIQYGVRLSDGKRNKAGLWYHTDVLPLYTLPGGNFSNRTNSSLERYFPEGVILNNNCFSDWTADYGEQRLPDPMIVGSNIEKTSVQIPVGRRKPFMELSKDSDSSVDSIGPIDRYVQREHLMKPPSPTNLPDLYGGLIMLALPPAPLSTEAMPNSDHCLNCDCQDENNERLVSGKQVFEEQNSINTANTVINQDKPLIPATSMQKPMNRVSNRTEQSLTLAASKGEPVVPVNVGDVEKISRRAVNQALYEIYQSEKNCSETLPLTHVNMDLLTNLQSFGVSSLGDIQMDAELKIKNRVSVDLLPDQESSPSRQHLHGLELSPSMASLLNKHNFRTNGPLIIVTADALEGSATEMVTSTESMTESENIILDEESSATDEENIHESNMKDTALACLTSNDDSKGSLLWAKATGITKDIMSEPAQSEITGTSLMLPTADTDMVDYIDYVLEIANVVLTESQLSAIRRQSQSIRLMNLWNDFQLGSIPEESSDEELEDTFLVALGEKLTSNDDELRSTHATHLSSIGSNPEHKEFTDTNLFDTFELSSKEIVEEVAFF